MQLRIRIQWVVQGAPTLREKTNFGCNGAALSPILRIPKKVVIDIIGGRSSKVYITTSVVIIF
jgi:hypothetical protein